MKSFRQLLRQPIKLIAGLILMTVAACIVCVCVGQALAAKNTAQQLERQFTTVALPNLLGGGGFDENGNLEMEVAQPARLRSWLEKAAKENPQIIKTLARHGFLSASIPELTPLNYTQGKYIAENFSGGNRRFYSYDPETDGRPYSGAMLVITLEEVTEPMQLLTLQTQTGDTWSMLDFDHEVFYWSWITDNAEDLKEAGYQITLSGTITDVISLQEGFRDPTGLTARLDISLPTLEEIEALDLQVGAQYLVYGMDYYDEDWAFRGLLADERGKNIQIDAFDPSKMRYYSKEEQMQNVGVGGLYQDSVTTITDDGNIIGTYITLKLTPQECARVNSISMTLWESFQYYSVKDWMGTYLHSPYFDLRPEATYLDRDGQEVTMSWEEFEQRYQIPTFTRLEGPVEDFLQSEAGAPWREALELNEVNHHAFAVFGVDRVMYLADFAQEVSRITQGRDFTEEEVINGDRVCIIHEAVAAASGLDVGDTVTLRFYQGDEGLPYQDYFARDGQIMPSADFYFRTTPITETAEFTIVGLWSSPDLWPDVALNEYALSPNTVMVPKTSTQTDWEFPSSVVFSTTVLHNGVGEEFRQLAQEAGFYGAFVCSDQGYTELVGNFHNYEELAQKVLTVGAVVYAVILLLFLLLFPGMQGKAVATMQSLGVSGRKRLCHVMNSVIGIAAPATVLGCGLGLGLWEKVLDALQSSAGSTVTLKMNPSVLILLALAQFAFTLLLAVIIAAVVAAPKGMGKRGK